jgi:hypothetical protein
MAIATVSAVAVNSQGADVPSVTRIPSAAAKESDAVAACAQAQAARKISGGETTTARRPPILV